MALERETEREVYALAGATMVFRRAARACACLIATLCRERDREMRVGSGAP
jgi:hexokinase